MIDDSIRKDNVTWLPQFGVGGNTSIKIVLGLSKG
jgi:hypothetical protein